MLSRGRQEPDLACSVERSPMTKRLWLSVVTLAIGASLLVAAGFASPTSSDSANGGKQGAKGGTLRVDLTADSDVIEAALSCHSHGCQMEYATSCKLLNFPDK